MDDWFLAANGALIIAPYVGQNRRINRMQLII